MKHSKKKSSNFEAFKQEATFAPKNLKTFGADRVPFNLKIFRVKSALGGVCHLLTLMGYADGPIDSAVGSDE